VSVAASDVSISTGLTAARFTNVWMPRLRSACGPVMVAPRSLYVSPTWTGEVAEYEAARILHIELTPARQAGYDGLERVDGVVRLSSG